MAREYFPGMGTAVADRTINRPGETWGDVAHRVASGNASLHPESDDYASLNHHLAQASTLLSGRSLQHGDDNQAFRPQEVFTNCSTAMLRFLTKKLLLSGSGVGSCYDDDLMVIDWAKNMPHVVCVIDDTHPDQLKGYMTARAAKHFYANRNIIHHLVQDSREGWAKAVELIESLSFNAEDQDSIVLLDFTLVREAGRPIVGMQNRPASGPGPLMAALTMVARVRGSAMAPWLAAMYIDHLLAECVLVGGTRRAARIAVKYWKDRSIFEFIQLKRPPEFRNKSRDEVIALREAGGYFESFLWSSNNSVAVDAEFWDRVGRVRDNNGTGDALDLHAYAVWLEVMDCQFGDGTGEPGFLNVDKLDVNKDGLDDYLDTMFAGSALYQLDEESKKMARELVRRVLDHPYHFIVNPCGEIVLFLLGGFCVIADVVPFHAKDDDDAEDAFRSSTRALMRINTMDSIYKREVMRTNRIGVGMTGLHEYMWDRFGLSFREAIAAGDIGPMGITAEAAPFWNMLQRFADAVADEATKYAAILGVVVPHTLRTMKPAGTTSKLFGLTEGAHLPSMRKLLRWVQFRNGDPLIEDYRKNGYPVRELVSYKGTTIVGFPTAPMITTLGMGDKLITASEATVEEQFRWIKLLEHFWIGAEGGNQISYTLKYDPEKLTFADYERMMFDNVSQVRCVSVMPQIKSVSYEYQPEQPVTDEEFEQLVFNIDVAMMEDIDREHVDCGGGACPIDFYK
ncbi:ribonucleoside-diphosphate reductase [Rhizobium arsenicireducens]